MKPASAPAVLESLSELTSRRIEATDGLIGNVQDFLLDDEKWVIRYLVANTSNWLPGPKVVISPYLVQDTDAQDESAAFPVQLTREQVRNAPRLEDKLPISLSYEQELARYYSYPLYHGAGPDLWGVSPYPILEEARQSHEREMERIGRSHLRSCNEVRGYDVHCTDDSIGGVADIIVDPMSWAIRYLVVDLRSDAGTPRRSALISPHWAKRFDWSERVVQLRVTENEIRRSPTYNPDEPPSREYEQQLHEHHQVQPYW